MSRLPTVARALSTQASRHRPTVSGVRVDKLEYTDTGGTGADATSLSSSLQEASKKARAIYRMALKDIPQMRKDFNIIEDTTFIRHTIRDLFERHSAVTDPKIVDMLVFKALQELREIREQWKSRHHVYGYIQRYTEKLVRDEAARRVEDDQSHSHEKQQMLAKWRDAGLVPHELLTWPMFLRWKQEEDAKFHAFALEHKLFTDAQLQRNRNASSQCTIM